MNESKMALTERLRREGRWDKASKFKDEALRQCRANGMRRDEASDVAWEAMEKAFPSIASTKVATADTAADTGPDEATGTLVYHSQRRTSHFRRIGQRVVA